MKWTHNLYRHETDKFGPQWHAGRFLGVPKGPDHHTRAILISHDVVGVYTLGPKELGLVRWARWRLRWYKWFFTGPNVILLRMENVDRHSIDLMTERWDAKEPVP
jgi:hypothetical protein